MGGKNATIVSRHSDLERAALGIMRSAFGLSGQKCSACSRVYVERPVAASLRERLVALAEQIAADAGLSSVRLYTNQRFEANIALYASLGYRIDREQALNGGVAVHMSKRVDHPAAIAAAIACVEAFTERFNAGDAAGMDALLHFPHVILDGARLIVWKTPGQLPQGYFDGLAAAGWRRSTYHDKRVVLSSPNKVHLLVDYSRDGEGGAVLSRHANLWIVTFEDGRWGVKQRSY